MKLFLAMVAAAAPLFAQQCTYVISGGTQSPAVFNMPAAASPDVNGPNTAVATVTAPDGCTWTATVNSGASSWLSVYNPESGKSGSGNGIVGFALARNPTSNARTGSIFIAGQTITVNQAGEVCAYTVSPTSMNFPVGGGTGTVQVGANCVWTTGISNNAVGWITIPPGTQGTFDGMFTYTVAANACLESRTGLLGVGVPSTPTMPSTVSTTLQIAEDGSPNNLTISPTTATISADATDGKINVTIGPNCPWSAFSDSSWLQITSASGGLGLSTLTYRAAANPSAPRTGNIHVGPQTFTITQQAVAAPPITLTAITNAASGLQGAVSPGEIVSLFGSNMGPTAGVGLQVSSDGKSISTSLGGVQVLFDGTAAALTYASAGQINAVVPYTLAGKFNTQVQVQYNGASSNILALGVQNAGPGIFTLDSSGKGAGAILNQDSTVNAPANRAARGSVIAIFLTGGGATDPVSVDASITSATLPLPMLTQPVSILIGGSVAPVIPYSGAAPGGIAGFTQINVVVPDGVIPGATVPIVVGIGAWVSQPGVTLAVK
jgi:uncharacterized protein (TIGR03437 family)